MSFANKFRDKAQVLRGRIKRNTGEVTGNRRLQAEGSADKVIGNLKQAGEKVAWPSGSHRPLWLLSTHRG